MLFSRFARKGGEKMNRTHRGNALLVELLIVVLFFMLASTVLLQLFATARRQGAKAEALTEATSWAQNIADALYAAPDAEEELAASGFSRDGEHWVLTGEALTASVALSREALEAGVLTRYSVSVLDGEEILISLPGVRYEEEMP
jgi:Tfp pilus assembly protein PilV